MKKTPFGVLSCTHCAIGLADDLNEFLFELVV